MNTQTTTQPLVKAVKRVAWGIIIFLVALNVIDLLVSLGIVIIQGNSNLTEGLKPVSATNGWAYMIAGIIGVILVLAKANQTERQQIFTARKTVITWQAIIGIILMLFVFQLGTELFGTIVEAPWIFSPCRDAKCKSNRNSLSKYDGLWWNLCSVIRRNRLSRIRLPQISTIRR